MNTWDTTSNINDILNNLDEDQLNEFCSNFYNNGGTESFNDSTNEFFACQLLNLIQCYGSQFINLIILLIFIYWWNNQMTNNYLMNSNCQLTNALTDLLEECFECNCCNRRDRSNR